MHFGIDAQCHERADIQVDDVGRGRLEYDLVLVIMLQAVGVLAVATVFGAARWLNVGGTPWLGADRAQEGGCMRGAGADFHVVGRSDERRVGKEWVRRCRSRGGPDQ